LQENCLSRVRKIEHHEEFIYSLAMKRFLFLTGAIFIYC